MGEILLYLALINQLGHKNYHNRDVATKFLTAMTFNSLPYVAQFTEDSNPERARRAASICDSTTGIVRAYVADMERKAHEKFMRECDNGCGFGMFGGFNGPFPMPPAPKQ